MPTFPPAFCNAKNAQKISISLRFAAFFDGFMCVGSALIQINWWRQVQNDRVSFFIREPFAGNGAGNSPI
jgi:hypothetical protein